MTRPPPLGVYVHWPYCARICPYCDFNVYRDRGRRDEAAALVRAIVQDLAAQAALTGPRELVSIYLGGGTPSLMTPEAVGAVLEQARGLWDAAPGLEVTLEANPTDAEADRFAAFAGAGVTRLSLGLQSLDDAALKALGRNHDADAATRAVAAAARAFPRLSVDLIYARPGQTVADWRAELAAVVDLGAEHVSPYQLTIEPGAAFARAVRRGQLTVPGEDLSADLFDTTQDVLSAAGFDAYEVSNHARDAAAQSRHNLVYWRGEDYVGAGPGAHGRLSVDGVRRATVAAARPADYIARVDATGSGFESDEALSPVEAAEERLLMGLRIEDGVAFADLGALGLTAAHPKVRVLVELGLATADATRIAATPAGRRVLDRLSAELCDVA